jgi:multidrug efflux pump subunit AcrB
VSGQFKSLDDIRNVPISAGGRVIKLGDFTTIRPRLRGSSALHDSATTASKVLMLGIVMTDDGNIVELGKTLEGTIAKVQAELPYGVELERVADQPTVVSESVWEFERSLLEALTIVLVVSLLSLGWRTGIVVGLSVPIVLGVVALVMLAMGWNLERVSLGSLIIALGLLVDDGIIAVEMMVVKMEEAGTGSRRPPSPYASTAMPRLTGALITVAAFMPIGFSKSTTGEYAGGIFWIVGTAVVFSWFVSGVITPYLAVKMLPDLKKHAGGDSYQTPFYKKLRGWIDSAIARRWWVIGATAAAFVLAVFGSRLVPQQFFPNSDRPELVVELRLKEGLLVRRHHRAGQEDGEALAKDEDVKFYTAYTGAGQPRFYLSLDPELPNPGYAVFVVMTKGVEARERVRSRLMAGVNEQFPNVWVRVTRLELGPPVGFPGAVPRRRSRHLEGARDRARGRGRGRREPEGARRAARLERPGADAPRRHRPGEGAHARPRARRRLVRHADVHERRDALAAAPARDLVDIVARAVPSERLNVETLKDVNLYTREGTVGAAVAGRAHRLRARGAGPVAAQPRHGDHRCARTSRTASRRCRRRSRSCRS